MLAVAVVQVDATASSNKFGWTSATTARWYMSAQADLVVDKYIKLTSAAGITGISACTATVAGKSSFYVTETTAWASGVVVLTTKGEATGATAKITIDCTIAGTATDDAWKAHNETDDTNTAVASTTDVLALFVKKYDTLKYTVDFYSTKGVASGGKIVLTIPGGSTASTCTIKSGSTVIMASGAGTVAAQVVTYTTTAAVARAGAINMDCTLTGTPTDVVWLVKTTTSTPADIDVVSTAESLNMFNHFAVAVGGSSTSSSKVLTFTIRGEKMADNALFFIRMPTGYAHNATANKCSASASTAGATPVNLVDASSVFTTTGMILTVNGALAENATLFVVCTDMTVPSTAVTTLSSWGLSVYVASTSVYPQVAATSYSSGMGLVAKINAKGAALLAPGNTVATNTGVFTATITGAVAAAAASTVNNLVLFASDATNAGFTAGIAAAGTKCTVDGASFTTSTANAADITTTMVIMRSAVAGGAIAANTKLTITCTNMTFTTSAATSDLFVLSVERSSGTSAGNLGTPEAFDMATSNAAGQTVGTVSSTLSVVDKAGTAFTLGAAPANYWLNVNADQYLKIAFAGVGTAVAAGTASVITVTVPAAWAFDTTNTKDNTTLKVAGTDVTAKYTIACATATVCTFTPKVAADGAVAVADAVEILFGKVTRSGAVVADESVTVSMVGNTSGNGFYLPKSNSMGAKGSVMKASIAGKKLTGSVSGFENAVTAGAANTSTVTPDTTYTFTTTANDCTGSLPAGKAITSAQTATVATLTMKSDAAIADAAAAKLAVLDFSCKLATVPTTFATGKTVAVTRHANESGTFDLSEDKGSSAASASSTVGVVLGAVFGVVGLAQLTL